MVCLQGQLSEAWNITTLGISLYGPELISVTFYQVFVSFAEHDQCLLFPVCAQLLSYQLEA